MESAKKVQAKRALQRQTQKALKDKEDLLWANTKIEKAVLMAAERIIEHSKKRGDSVNVTNFPTTLATSSDIEALRKALEKKDYNIQVTTKNGTEELSGVLKSILAVMQSISEKDDSDVVSALDSLEQELKDKDVTVTNLDDLGDFFFSLERAIEKKDLTVDLSPLKDLSSEIKKLSNMNISLPDGLMDKTNKLLEKQNDKLNKLITKPTPVGSGGALGGGGGGVGGTVDVSDIKDGAGDSIMDAANDAMRVNVVAGSTSGTQYTEGDADTTITGTAVMWEDTSNILRAVSTSKALPTAQYFAGTAASVNTGNANDGTQRVVLASDQPVIPVSDNGGSLTVDGTVTANLSATDNAVLDAIQAAVEGVLSVKSEKASSAGTSTGVTVGSTSTTVLASNASRKAAIIVNDSDETVYLKYGTGATSNSGIRLNANGGLVREEMYTGIITGICASGSKVVTVTEI